MVVLYLHFIIISILAIYAIPHLSLSLLRDLWVRFAIIWPIEMALMVSERVIPLFDPMIRHESAGVVISYLVYGVAVAIYICAFVVGFIFVAVWV